MSKRRPWVTTAALLGILILLAAYVFLVEVKREPPPEEDALPTPAPLWEFSGRDVIGITVTRGERRTAVERAGDEWRMTAPTVGQADSARLDGLVYGIASIKFTRAIADVGDLAAFGLQEPEMRVTLVLSDRTTINVGIGVENPRHTDRYVQKEGDALVYLVSIGELDRFFRLVDEPPYPPTPTPLPSPLEVPTLEPSPVPVETPVEMPSVEPSSTPGQAPVERPTPTALPQPRPTPTPAS